MLKVIDVQDVMQGTQSFHINLLSLKDYIYEFTYMTSFV